MRVLIIAHNETDYHLTQTCLTSATSSVFDLCWKPTFDDGLACLEAKATDVILLYAPLPDTTLQAAVTRLTLQFPTVPMIVVLEAEHEALPVSPILDTLSRQELSPVLLEKMLHHVVERSQFQFALQESENRYHALLNHAHDAVFLLDLNGQHMDVNQRAADLLGYSLDEANLLSLKDTSGELNASKMAFQRLLANRSLPKVSFETSVSENRLRPPYARAKPATAAWSKTRLTSFAAMTLI
jgi:PAS domain S-box-containing protein